MEGASWLANKGIQEASKHSTKLQNLAEEFDKRAVQCVTDPTINDVNYPLFQQLKDWTYEYINREADDVKVRFEILLENVNYNLSQANQVFAKK